MVRQLKHTHTMQHNTQLTGATGEFDFEFGLKGAQMCTSGICLTVNWNEVQGGYASTCNSSGQAAIGLLVVSIILLLIIIIVSGLAIAKRGVSLHDNLNYSKILIPLVTLVTIFTLAANANWRTNCHNKIQSYYDSINVPFDLKLSRYADVFLNIFIHC